MQKLDLAAEADVMRAALRYLRRNPSLALGLALLMASKFVGVRFSQALRAALPIYVVFFATIGFAIYFPEVVLWLPKHVIPASVGCFKAPEGPGFICPR